MPKSIVFRYLIMTAITLTPLIGGKYVSTAYAAFYKLDPVISIALITISETLLCTLLFFIGIKLKSLKSLEKLLNSKKTKKAHGFVLKYGSFVGLFIGQMFIGAPPISLALGIIYEKEKNIVFYFFLPLFISIFLYSIFNFYLNAAAITSLKGILKYW